jgi:hypothetical protein
VPDVEGSTRSGLNRVPQGLMAIRRSLCLALVAATLCGAILATTPQMGASAATPLTITTTSLPSTRVEVGYNQTLTATGGTAPYVWSIAAGSLPPELNLDPSTGAITGTATTVGTYDVTFAVTDSDQTETTADLSIVVAKGTTALGLVISPNASVLGSPVTYSVVVVAGSLVPTGEVTLSIGSLTLCTTSALAPITGEGGGMGSCVASNAPAGTNRVTATYPGDSNFIGSSTFRAAAVAGPDPYSPLAPVRICDTRAGNPSGLTGDAAQCSGAIPPIGDSPTVIRVAGEFGVPADATAVVLNVTVVNPPGPGFITVNPDDLGNSSASSNINYAAGETVPNLVEVSLGPSPDVAIFSSNPADLVVDVEGYTSPTAAGGSGSGLYNALTSPDRICDTRAMSSFTSANQCNGPGNAAGTLTAGGSQDVAVTNGGTIPSGAIAAVLNVTVVNPKLAGYLTVYPQGGSRPDASNVNYAAGQTTSNRVIVPLSAGGGVTVWSSESTDVVVDVSGYFSASGGTGTQFTAQPLPVRICDTRPVTSFSPLNQCSNMPVAGGNSNVLNVKATDMGGVPAGATAVVINLTGVSPSQSTFLTMFPGADIPGTSDLNLAAYEVRASMVVATINPITGDVSVLNNTGSLDVIVDVLGWYS